MELKHYQEDCVNNLIPQIHRVIDREQQIFILQSPTGSGKTVMMADLIQKLADYSIDNEIVFIWITVHTLHEQSMKKLESYYEDTQSITCSLFNDLTDKQIQDREIVFFNWQSINQDNNIIIRENELDFNLDNILKNTREQNRRIVMIIDESHHTARGEESINLIQRVNPNIILEVSATPNISSVGGRQIVHTETVEFEDVVGEEMIKKGIHINTDLSSNTSGDIDNLIIKHALEKRNKLKEYYESEGSDVNPLVLIQLPNSRRGAIDRLSQIENILKQNFDKTIDNGTLAVDLADDKRGTDNIESNQASQEVIIFKQTLSLGWDCPRASILVMFREPRDLVFTVQTIGRIMRMSERRHYTNDELNYAYVYTNQDDDHIKITNYIAKDYFKQFESIRQENYTLINIPSIYVTRQHARTRLTSEFKDKFNDVASQQKLHTNLDYDTSKFKYNLIRAEVTQLDLGYVTEEELIPVNPGEKNMQNLFDNFLRKSSSGFAPVHSSERIKSAIYLFFREKLKIQDEDDMQKITLMTHNRKLFSEVIEKAKEIYRHDVIEKLNPNIEKISKWNAPENILYSKEHREITNYNKCLMNPLYITNPVINEERFMQYIDDKNNSVDWWFKNGTRDKKYFAIQYTDDEDTLRGFYPDFILYMSDGRIGIFDPKAGFTAMDDKAKLKAEALSKYIRNHPSKKLCGGIAVFSNNEWLYNNNAQYHYDSKDFSEWKPIDLNTNNE